MLETLLTLPFPGSPELRDQLGSVKVVEEYPGDDPSVVFCADEDAAPAARVRNRVPVEARGRDEDGTTVHVLLHVLDGYVAELELFRPDGKRVRG